MLSPAHLTGCFRALLLLGAGVGVVLLLGPFQGLERSVGLSDAAAHGIAFYLLTVGLFLSAPKWRRTDLALVAAGLAIVSEVAQALAGRGADPVDLLFDLTGVCAAIAPGLAERLRHHARAHPNLSFRAIRLVNRRLR